MPKLTIDGIEVEVEPGTSLLQACEAAGKEIPRFCYHERLSIAGNCRMCLIEVEGGPPKPVASCAMPAADKMVVHTDTPMVKKAREGVMEFLLANHPLDCPICDQGGECDLQDQAMGYGVSGSRYFENKRAVEDKYMGPLIKTEMTRCIHCTRCVRFTTEIAGVSELGATGRGEDMEITTYLEQAVLSELSGNVIDLCPVGALTSKPYAFTARPWELTKIESVDVMDAVGSNIRVDSRDAEVMRVLPVNNDDVNEEWISDKTRFIWDGLKRQRLDTPYIREGGRLRPASWNEALSLAAQKMKAATPAGMAAIAGDLACAESMMALKDLWDKFGSPHIDCRQDGAKLGAASRGDYLFNSTFAGIEQADALLLIGCNPRWEAAVLNARIVQRARRGGFAAASIGAPFDSNFPCEMLGAGPRTLQDLADGEHSFADTLKQATRPMLIVGMGALARPDGAAVLAAAKRLAQNVGVISSDWNGFNVLHTAAARVAGLDLGLLPGEGGLDVAGMLEGAQSGTIGFVYLLGADELDLSQMGKAFVVYQGSHGDAGAHRADLVLPGAAYTEKSGTYVNSEGRVQIGVRAIFPPGAAREDWTILRALSESAGHKLPYDNLSALRARMIEAAPHMREVGRVHGAALSPPDEAAGAMSDAAFAPAITDFFLTNPIARASAIMAECSALAARSAKQAAGSHG
ncbi:MAG: NADH-quinone oxidoreductase subunit NuoG [Alphaproteobacteria bacterium]